MGIVGRNGSGKSTLLKLLAGIYAPDMGEIVVNGKLTPFIELGVGFNPELTGRENVYLNGALLGFSTKETDTMYDGIVEFAEIEQFMDQKLKNYSSGMQVRLAFSIAICAKSDVLLIDEVLAVGDEAFQRKCIDVFERYKAEKQTVVLVTHDMETVKKFCSRAMLIHDGEIVEIGNPRIVADKYSAINQASIDSGVEKDNKKSMTQTKIKVKILDKDNNPKAGFAFGEQLRVRVNWQELLPTPVESIGIHIFKLSGEHITGINSRTSRMSGNWQKQGQLEIGFHLNIQPGKYYILVEAFKQRGVVLDSINEGLQFSVAKHEMTWSGMVELPHTWHNVDSK